jgi:hypothetical protein
VAATRSAASGPCRSLDRAKRGALRSGSVNVPITDKLLTRWTVANLYRDGYVHDITTNLNNGGINQQLFHGDILWMPTDRITWRFNYQTDHNAYTEPRIQDAVFHGTLAEAGNGIGSIDFYGLAGQAPFTAATQMDRPASGATAPRSRCRTPSLLSSSHRT